MAAIALAFALTPAFAQNTASIPSATVNAGETVVEFRAGYGANDGGAADIYSQRIYVNYAPTGDLRLTAFIEQRRSSDRRDVFRRLSPNAFTQFVQTERWDLAVRRQGDIPLEDGVPGRLRLGLLSTWRFGDVELRSNVYFGREIGENAPDGFLFEMRAAAALRISPSLQIDAQVFNNFISSKTFGDFDRQRHQAGPFVRTRIGKSLRIEARGVLFGLSASSPDVEPRLFAGYAF